MYKCQGEDEARDRAVELIEKKLWPCSFFKSDTSGEKDFEEFYTKTDVLDLGRYAGIGVISNTYSESDRLDYFLDQIAKIRSNTSRDKTEIINLFNEVLQDFSHLERGKHLDSRM